MGVVIANLDLIMGWCVMDPSVRALVVALLMAVLSPIMAALGGGDGLGEFGHLRFVHLFISFLVPQTLRWRSWGATNSATNNPERSVFL
ncbi:MAG: hypothetical protein IJ125_01940 [Atopobiaceae bacterium]|nr:hypothetical protein [Atopobiaceae bacterium]